MLTARLKARRKSAAQIKKARTELIDRQGRLWALDREARTAEALEWSAKRRAEIQIGVDALTRALRGRA
jgi:hypothetical protein